MSGSEVDPRKQAEESVAFMLEHDTARKALGIEIDEVGPGTARATMTITDQMLNGHRTAHGGYIYMLADIAFAFACNSHGENSIGRSCDIEYLAPGYLGDHLAARATERFREGRSAIYDVTVLRESDGVILAEFRGHSRTFSAARNPLDSQSP